MISRFEALLTERYDTFTVSERVIAGWLQRNMASIPFETAASIGQRVGVSAMTVGRFLKSLGYARMAALKDDLRGDFGDLAPRLPLAKDGGAALDARLAAETAAIAGVYRLAETPEWHAIVALLAGAGKVAVIGFQTEQGLAAGFAHHLGYVRPGVSELDARTGTYAGLEECGPGDVLLLVDLRRYSRHFRLLAETAAAHGLDVVVVTDPYCPWAHDLTPHILTAEVSLGHFWDMNTALASLLNLLVDDVVRVIGADAVHRRLERLSDRYEAFVGFQHRSLLARPPLARPPGK